MAFILSYSSPEDDERIEEEFDAELDARHRACQLLRNNEGEDFNIQLDDQPPHIANDEIVSFCNAEQQSSGGGGGGAYARTIPAGRRKRTLQYTVAFFRQGGEWAVVLVDEGTINNPQKADQLTAFLQSHFGMAVLLIANSGRRRGLNPSLVRNFNVHPSQIRGWQRITLTVDF
ncbi:MAG: hypothetical protein ACK4GK_00945 [Ferrovibrio sp.]